MHTDCRKLHNKCGSCGAGVFAAVASVDMNPFEVPRPEGGWQPRIAPRRPWYSRCWRSFADWWSNLWRVPRLSNAFRLDHSFAARERRKKIGVVAVIIAVIGSIWGYKVAYENSAVTKTIVVAEKWRETHASTDDDGHTSTSYSYHVYTHGGLEYNCGIWGADGQHLYGRLRVNHTYEVVVAGVFSQDDIIAVNRMLR